MERTTVVQGRRTSAADIEFVRHLIASNPSWNRTRISEELCLLWDWRTPAGRLKDMACRSFLLKLEEEGIITLPPRQRIPRGARTAPVREVPHDTEPVDCDLGYLMPIQVGPVEVGDLALFRCLVSSYHYLGFKGNVGQNMAYMARDRTGRPLACLLFGSAAWKCAPRDAFLGWEPSARESNVNLITNNMRFLILPWVRVPNLASHILSRVAIRISADWRAKYGHPLYLLETFVERGRFAGSCYRAANWICLGGTKGRSRNDRDLTMRVPVKDVYVYPLTKTFREALCA